MSFSVSSDKFDEELRTAVRQEVYDRFYNVFGHLLSEELYLELIEPDVEMLVAERKERINNVLRYETSLAVESGTPQVPDDLDCDIFGDPEYGGGYEAAGEEEEKEEEKEEISTDAALAPIPESDR